MMEDYLGVVHRMYFPREAVTGGPGDDGQLQHFLPSASATSSGSSWGGAGAGAGGAAGGGSRGSKKRKGQLGGPGSGTKEAGTDTLDEPGLNVERMTHFGMLLSPIRKPSVLDFWAPYEISLFEAAICVVGKRFSAISRAVSCATKEADRCNKRREA